jgi:flagellar biosynthetic protein FliR
MSQAALNQLVNQIGGAHITAFFLVLARVGPLFVLAPLFSSKLVSARIRSVVAVALALGLTGVAAHGQHLPTSPLPVAGLLVVQLLVGLAFAFAVGAVFAAVEGAGTFIDALAGFSFGQMINPVDGSQAGVISELYGMVGVVLFIAVGGDAWTLRGLARTFDLVPLTRGPQLSSLVGGVEQAFAAIFTSALEVAAPAMLALLITDVAFGVVSRVVPQMNVFAVGFPTKIGIAILIVTASLPFLGGWLSGQLANAVQAALHSITTV